MSEQKETNQTIEFGNYIEFELLKENMVVGAVIDVHPDIGIWLEYIDHKNKKLIKMKAYPELYS